MEKENFTPISAEAKCLLDKMPFLKSEPIDDADTAKREVVRGILFPMAFFAIERKQSAGAEGELGRIQTPGELIAITVNNPTLSLSMEERKQLILEFGPGEHRDWGTIASSIALKSNHPLSLLSEKVIGNLSSESREELMKIEF